MVGKEEYLQESRLVPSHPCHTYTDLWAWGTSNTGNTELDAPFSIKTNQLICIYRQQSQDLPHFPPMLSVEQKHKNVNIKFYPYDLPIIQHTFKRFTNVNEQSLIQI